MLKKDNNNSLEGFKFCTEQGLIINQSNLDFKKIPFCSKHLIKLIFLNKIKFLKDQKKNIKLYNSQNFILKYYMYYNFIIYNGRVFHKFRYSKLRIFQRFGAFFATRVLNSGRVLHLRKKTVKKK
jgi:ribosomal protein S19